MGVILGGNYFRTTIFASSLFLEILDQKLNFQALWDKKLKIFLAVGQLGDNHAVLSPTTSAVHAMRYLPKTNTQSDNPLCSTTGVLLCLMVVLGPGRLQGVAICC